MDNLTDVNDRPYEVWICEVEVLGNYETMSIDEYEKLVG
jgi:glycine cleavage system H protein